jgi:hypothetical protein
MDDPKAFFGEWIRDIDGRHREEERRLEKDIRDERKDSRKYTDRAAAAAMLLTGCLFALLVFGIWFMNDVQKFRTELAADYLENRMKNRMERLEGRLERIEALQRKQ